MSDRIYVMRAGRIVAELAGVRSAEHNIMRYARGPFTRRSHPPTPERTSAMSTTRPRGRRGRPRFGPSSAARPFPRHPDLHRR